MRPHASARLIGLLTTGVLAVALTGCGDDATSEAADPRATPASDTSTATVPDAPATTKTPKPKPVLPDCADVWVEGNVLPKKYRGCEDAKGKVSKSVRGCSIGSKLGQYGDQYYAILGRDIVRALPSRNENQDYLDLLETCTG